MVGGPRCERCYYRFVGAEGYTLGISDIAFRTKELAFRHLNALATEEEIVDAVAFVRLRSPSQFVRVDIGIVRGEGEARMSQHIGVNRAIAVVESSLDECCRLRPRYHYAVMVVQVACLLSPVLHRRFVEVAAYNGYESTLLVALCLLKEVGYSLAAH